MPASNPASASSGASSRPDHPRLLVVLKLSSDLLGRFASPATDTKDEATTPNKETEVSSPVSSSADPVVPASSADNASDAASTPAAAVSTTTPAAETPRRKGQAANPRSGSKRGLGDSAPRSRGRPGPKKRAKLEEGATDQVRPGPVGPRPGPRANTGAINAGLRALDRSGAPCRKWEKKPLQLKSFTGIVWQLPTWRSPKPLKVDESGHPKEIASETGDSDSKVLNGTSAVPSEKSNSGEGDLTPLPPNMVDSPASPAIAMTA